MKLVRGPSLINHGFFVALSCSVFPLPWIKNTRAKVQSRAGGGGGGWHLDKDNTLNFRSLLKTNDKIYILFRTNT